MITTARSDDIIGAINWYGSSASAHTLGASIDVRQDGSAKYKHTNKNGFLRITRVVIFQIVYCL